MSDNLSASTVRARASNAVMQAVRNGTLDSITL